MLRWYKSYGHTVQFTFLNNTIVRRISQHQSLLKPILTHSKLSTDEPGHVKVSQSCLQAYTH